MYIRKQYHCSGRAGACVVSTVVNKCGLKRGVCLLSSINNLLPESWTTPLKEGLSWTHHILTPVVHLVTNINSVYSTFLCSKSVWINFQTKISPQRAWETLHWQNTCQQRDGPCVLSSIKSHLTFVGLSDERQVAALKSLKLRCGHIVVPTVGWAIGPRNYHNDNVMSEYKIVNALKNQLNYQQNQKPK